MTYLCFIASGRVKQEPISHIKHEPGGCGVVLELAVAIAISDPLIICDSRKGEREEGPLVSIKCEVAISTAPAPCSIDS